MGKYKTIIDGDYTIIEITAVLATVNMTIANELAEANRLKRLELIRHENVVIENPYSEKDDIIVANKMLKELEDQA